MASTYSSDLKLELMATGENAGTWGDKTNTNLNLVQQAIAGFEQVTLTSGGTVALVMSDGALSNARNLVIKFATITAAASTVCTPSTTGAGTTRLFMFSKCSSNDLGVVSAIAGRPFS